MSTNLALPLDHNARSHPERLALSVHQRDFTDGELVAITEQIAAWLGDHSPAEAKLVGILASRSWLAFGGILAACWSGALYVPLNPDWPEQRLLSILATTELDTLLVDDRGLKLLSPQVLQQGVKHILASASHSSSWLGSAPITDFDALPPLNRQNPPLAGNAFRLPAQQLQNEFATALPLQRILLRYTLALLTQVSQTAVCNRLHTIEQRLCRWLLLCHDRKNHHELHMTQGLIANMLGGRRESVTVAAGHLQDAGLIHYCRGRIRILNRLGLEASACECYHIVEAEFERLLGTKRKSQVSARAGSLQEAV